MKIKPLFILLVAACLPEWSKESNHTTPEGPINIASLSEDDSEQELSAQLEEANDISEGWSKWSNWSPCSRSCDGGIAHQLRNCVIGKCRGNHVRHRICNMQTFITFFAALASTYAAPSATVIQGPSARSTVVGVDGSLISSVAPGGQIVAEEHAGYVAHAAPAVVSTYNAGYPAVSAYSAYSHPVVSAYSSPVVSAYSSPVVSAYSSPVVSAYSSPVVSAYSAYSSPVVSAYSSPVGHGVVDTVVAGPSGTIATSRHGVVGAHGLYY